MMNFLNRNLEKIGVKKFLIFAPILTLLCDALLVYYATTFLLPNTLTRELMIQAIAKQGINVNHISFNDLEEGRQVLLMNFKMVFYGALIYHSVIQFFFSRKKEWAIKYVHFYCLTTALLSIADILGPIFTSMKFSPYTTFTVIGYVFVYFGINYFKKKKEL